MKQAIITTGGKQYLVGEGSKVRVEKLPVAEGAVVNFEEVLLAVTEKTFKLGSPLVSGANVEGKVIRHGRADKVTGVKMKAKKRYKKYFGHRQHFTEVEITKISTK